MSQTDEAKVYEREVWTGIHAERDRLVEFVRGLPREAQLELLNSWRSETLQDAVREMRDGNADEIRRLVLRDMALREAVKVIEG